MDCDFAKTSMWELSSAAQRIFTITNSGTHNKTTDSSSFFFLVVFKKSEYNENCRLRQSVSWVRNRMMKCKDPRPGPISLLFQLYATTTLPFLVPCSSSCSYTWISPTRLPACLPVLLPSFQQKKPRPQSSFIHVTWLIMSSRPRSSKDPF